MNTDLDSKGNVQLTADQHSGMLILLRDARATVLRDSESFDEAASMLEHAGQILAGAVRNGLGHYRDEICGLAKKAPDINSDRVDQLFSTVLHARNDAVHGGSYIRHHANHLVNLLLILEEALMESTRALGDLMVQNPVTAELWQNIATIRRAMLANSFSYLPIRGADGVWQVVSVYGLVKYVKSGVGGKNAKLGKRLDDALATKDICLETCESLPPTATVADVFAALDEKPLLVVESFNGTNRLVGILTAFDLL